MLIYDIYDSLIRRDPKRPDASDAVVISDEMRSWLSDQDVADLEDYFLEVQADDDAGPVELSATTSAQASEEPAR